MRRITLVSALSLLATGVLLSASAIADSSHGKGDGKIKVNLKGFEEVPITVSSGSGELQLMINEAAGTIVIDTPNTYLYLVLGNGKAMRYGIGVGREGFTWSGVKTVERKTEWPDWYPPSEMLARQPYLPRMTAGGPGNPLGARAMYIAGTQYRIHGTNAPSTIGRQVSSGCIRLTNEDVIDLFDRVQIGAKVIVMPQTASAKSRQGSMAHAYAPQLQSRAQATWETIRPSGRY